MFKQGRTIGKDYIASGAGGRWFESSRRTHIYVRRSSVVEHLKYSLPLLSAFLEYIYSRGTTDGDYIVFGIRKVSPSLLSPLSFFTKQNHSMRLHRIKLLI